MLQLPFTMRQLEVFASLATTSSFRRSADALAISQASVSNQIKALEEQLGTVLFDRAPGRRPVLTVAGLAFQADLRGFEQAAAVLAAHRVGQRDEPPGPAHFRLLVGQGMFDAYIRRKLDQFHALHGDIELELETQLPFGKLFQAVETGQFDFALINQRADQQAPDEMHSLALVSGGIYGHAKYAEGHSLPLSSDMVSALPFILPKATSTQEREVLRNYSENGIRPSHVIGHTQYYDVMAAMLERGLGVASFSAAILPAAMRRDVILLYPLHDWRLLYFRAARLHDDRRADAVEAFLINSVLDDPDYPAQSRGWTPKTADYAAYLG